MYGGTGRGRLSAVSLTVSLLMAMTGCRTDESESEVRVPTASTTDASTRADLSDHPDPVPYGESTPATPTADPTATPAPSHDPGTIQTVLVAADTIAAGESLADAQMTGKLELASVPGEEVVPGAVASTEGLDGVALEELTTGEQITEASFG